MKIILTAVFLLLASGIASAAELKDQHDITNVHRYIEGCIKEIQWARAANPDMGWHGSRAEELLREADKEFQLAVEAAKKH